MATSINNRGKDGASIAALPAPGMSNRSQSVRLTVYGIQALVDLIALSVGFIASHLIFDGIDANLNDIAAVMKVVPLFVLVSFYGRAYSYEAMISSSVAVERIISSLALTLAIALAIIYATKDLDDIPRSMFFSGALLAAFLLILGRVAMIRFVNTRLDGRFMRRMLIVDGEPAVAPRSFETIEAADYGLRPDVNDPIMLHNFSCLVRDVDRVVISCPADRQKDWATYLKSVGCWGELLVPQLTGLAPLHDEAHLGLVGIRVSSGPLDLRNRLLKRVLDLALTIPLIFLLTSLWLIVALAIKLDSPGPVLFRQQRMGRSNRLFHIYKFRSMRTEQSDSTGNRSASRDDDRITRVGRVIRATSIDELPQLFNVLMGDMSLVGPRPHALGSLAGDQLFWHIDPRYWLRHAIKPGITGLAQVRGHRGATAHRSDLDNRLQSDLEYVARWTIWRDLTILMRTLAVVVHKNAY